MLGEPSVSVLGPDPTHQLDDRGRSHVLNGNAFQQDAIRSFAGWQYVCFYSPLSTTASSASAAAVDPVYIHLARRKLPRGLWQTLVFDDYPQTTDDGHNTVQFGICPGDGTIHLSYDHHCDRLRYRHSIPNLATAPETFGWSSSLFTPTLFTLPGLSDNNDPELGALLGYITYPRFGPLGDSKLWFSFRTGKAGLGDDHLAVYDPAKGGYGVPVTHLKGIDSNPYINGLDYHLHRDHAVRSSGDGSTTLEKTHGALYTTWVYRGFVWYPGWDDPTDTKHKAQAGPNSGENNHDLCFAFSEDEGITWRNNKGHLIAEKGASIEPSSLEVRVYEIPKGSGLANQESQAVDIEGGVHVLNRDSLPDADADGERSTTSDTAAASAKPDKHQVRWKHYYRNPRGTWRTTILPHVNTSYGGKRGQMVASRHGDVYFILPEVITTSLPSTKSPQQRLTILKASRKSDYTEYELIWQGGEVEGDCPSDYDDAAQGRDEKLRFPPSEPLVDRGRLMDGDGVLSVFTRCYGRHARGMLLDNADDLRGKTGECVDVVVVDFQL